MAKYVFDDDSQRLCGNRHSSFKSDLLRQTADFKNIAVAGKNFCIIGDFNCSFADNYYFTTFGRNTLPESFEENKELSGHKGIAVIK